MGKRYMVYNNQLWDPIESFDYTGTMEEFTLNPGTYLFVADGARGGTVPNGNTFVSYGGSTYGILDLNHKQKFYAVVGGNGEDSNTGGDNPKGGYNRQCAFDSRIKCFVMVNIIRKNLPFGPVTAKARKR